jgi:hypothetical protein
MPGAFTARSVRHRTATPVVSAISEAAIALQLMPGYLQAPDRGGHPLHWRRTIAGQPSALKAVRAEKPVQGSDQQGCHPSRLTLMITGHVPAVRPPPDHADRLMAAAVPAPGDVADHRDLDPAPPARCPAEAAAVPPETELGGPRPARDPARRDTESAAPRTAAAGHPGHHAALAPGHRPPPLGRQVHTRQDRPAGPGDADLGHLCPAEPRNCSSESR